MKHEIRYGSGGSKIEHEIRYGSLGQQMEHEIRFGSGGPHQRNVVGTRHQETASGKHVAQAENNSCSVGIGARARLKPALSLGPTL